MSPEASCDDGWTFETSAAADIDQLMDWFPEAADINVWGGPSFRYPFTAETFREDVYWGRMVSYSLRNPFGGFAAFGQLYEKLGRINLARLVVNPAMRRQGVGKRLVGALMTVGGSMFPGDEFSLFVFRGNTPAYECYKSMGFVVRDYPESVPHADMCYYLTRPMDAQQ